MTPGYHGSRLTHDAKRDVLWHTLWHHRFKPLVPEGGCVVDLGCGYGSFINQVGSGRRIAVDTWPEFPGHLAPGVEPILGSVTDLAGLPDRGVDLAFASNLFEHLVQDDLASVLAALRSKLSATGTLALVQPNYRYAYAEYFDDYTHVTAYSHISLADFLVANGYELLEVVPRFLPLTVKSRLPVHPWRGAPRPAPFRAGGTQWVGRAGPAGAR